MSATEGSCLAALLTLVLVTAGAEKVEFWQQQGHEALRAALNLKQNTNVAKNVILCIGDGMGLSTVTPARIYKGQKAGMIGEMASFTFESFPYVGLSKTFSNDRQVTESGAACNAMLAGTKVNSGTLGVNTNVVNSKCATMPGNEIDGMLHWSLEAGKRVGIVTSTRITHATPSAAYAHCPDRWWENDALIPESERAMCTDIAYQLVYNNTNINVLFGGGRRNFLNTTESDPEYPSKKGKRTDGKNLIQAWIDDKKSRDVSHAYMWNKSGFDGVDPETTDYVLGLFEPSHMQYALDKQEDGAGEPTLAELAEKAVKILRRGDKGFFLLLEGGRIDHAHHDNLAKYALDETEAFDNVIQKLVEMTSEDDTLIIVTADHSHPFAMGSWASLNNPILGYADAASVKTEPATDGLPYLTLTYGNGPGPQARTNNTDQDTTDKKYVFPSNIHMAYDTHGGEDVAIYARGPMAHLINGVQQNAYIAHVMAYASCVGDNKEHCTPTSNKPPKCKPSSADRGANQWQSVPMVLGVLAHVFHFWKI